MTASEDQHSEPGDYDEFAALAGNAAELGLPSDDLPPRRREAVAVGSDQTISAIVWGTEVPDLVFLHGGGQNAHTWDTVLLALGRPALVIDLPGHGHSSWREDHDYSPADSARAVAEVISELAAPPVDVVGMSLGGLTALELAHQFPDRVGNLLLVDVTPGTAVRVGGLTAEQRGAVALVSGPASFDSFEAMVAAAVGASGRRDPASVRRGVRHNAMVGPDGRWRWRYDSRRGPGGSSEGTGASFATSTTWDVLDGITAPITLVRGGDSAFVQDEDVSELTRRRPGTRLEVVPDSGHSVQSDQPMALVELLRAFLARSD